MGCWMARRVPANTVEEPHITIAISSCGVVNIGATRARDDTAAEHHNPNTELVCGPVLGLRKKDENLRMIFWAFNNKPSTQTGPTEYMHISLQFIDTFYHINAELQYHRFLLIVLSQYDPLFLVAYRSTAVTSHKLLSSPCLHPAPPSPPFCFGGVGASQVVLVSMPWSRAKGRTKSIGRPMVSWQTRTCPPAWVADLRPEPSEYLPAVIAGPLPGIVAGKAALACVRMCEYTVWHVVLIS